MEAAGFAPADYDVELDVYPENHEAVVFFMQLTTQWRHGMDGRTGLDYTAVLALLRSKRLPRDKSQDVFECVQVMELAALEAMKRG